MVAAIDYRGHRLIANGNAVDWVRVTGELVERALATAQRHGLGALRPSMLPGALGFALDGHGGERDVLTHADDRSLACHLVRGLRVCEHGLGFAQLGAVVAAKQAGKRVSDHDQVLEVVCGPRGDRLSAEVKTKRVRDERHRDRIRGWIQADADSEWWRRAVATDKSPAWAGRLVILLEVPAGPRVVAQAAALASPAKTFCDVLMCRVGAEWRGVWGWPRALGMAALARHVSPLGCLAATAPELAAASCFGLGRGCCDAIACWPSLPPACQARQVRQSLRGRQASRPTGATETRVGLRA